MPVHPSRKLTVFIADDSAFIRGSLSSYLLSYSPGIEIVGFAGTAPEAIESIRALKPDVAILDIRMPGGSGIGVLTAIKSDRSNPFVIMFTNETATHVRDKCIELGADRFFDKSTEFENLHIALSGLVQKRCEPDMEPAAAST
jgi:DNA-binding NarL/FixJ family response regulator